MSQLAYPVEDLANVDMQKAAQEIFPLFTETDNPALRRQYAITIADILGTSGEFHKYVQGNAGDLTIRRTRLMAIFRDNVHLLLTKTWVEEHDSHKKDDAFEELDSFVGEITRFEFDRALAHFVNISDLLARLMFGEEPADEDFFHYVYRIDPKLGMFYWFVERLRHPATVMPDPDLTHLQLLVGIYALASY